MDIQQIVNELYSIRDYMRFGVSQFNASEIYYGHGTNNAWDEALAIILHVLYLPIDSGDEILDARLLTEEKEAILFLFQLRMDERIPVPYLTHTAWFCGLKFYVDGRVSIPRSPIAELIKANFKPWYQGEYPFRILDLCAGSGCIGIACASVFDEADIVLADISADALTVAEENIARHGMQNNVFTQQSDLFDQLDGLYDIIVCSPPYMDAEDFSTMPEEYRHEPAEALQSGAFGLEHPLQILRQAADFLTEEGILVLEVGSSRQHLEEQYPGIDFNWVELQQGDHGVLVMSKAELEYYEDQLALEPYVEDVESDF